LRLELVQNADQEHVAQKDICSADSIKIALYQRSSDVLTNINRLNKFDLLTVRAVAGSFAFFNSLPGMIQLVELCFAPPNTAKSEPCLGPRRCTVTPPMAWTSWRWLS